MLPVRIMCPASTGSVTPVTADARCEFPLTMPNCVDAIITDLALLRRPDRSSRFTLEEIAAGFTVDEVLSLTGMAVEVADEVRVMQESWI